MAVNYDDKRFQEVEADKKAALTETEKMYGGMINASDKFYNDQMDAANDWADKQAALQKEQTEFAIDKIEQEKAQAEKDYTREQSGAYVDWQKQSNEYGANAEKMASSGMQNTGFAESSQVSMYNTYQQRVTAARESFNLAVQDFTNQMTQARLQNNAALAKIYAEAHQKRLELALQGFQYKNSLTTELANKKLQIDSEYHQRYQDVLAQINQENALAEQIRQHNEQMAEKKRQFDAQMAEEKRQFNVLHSSSGSSGGGSGGGSGGKINKGSKAKSSSTKKSEIVQTNRVESSGKKNNSSGGIDMGSVLALGYGPISASKLNTLVKQGIVEEYQSGGKTKFRKTASTNKQFQLYSKLKG